MRRYGQWAGNPRGFIEDPERCVKEVYARDARSIVPYQCDRKRGHGPSGEYCKQHGKKEQERLDRLALLTSKENQHG